VKSTLSAIALGRILGNENPWEIIDGEQFKGSTDFGHKHNGTLTFKALSSNVRRQLVLVALAFFKDCKETLLQEFDRLVFRKRSDRSWQLESSCSDPLIVGLCIRRMALQYRHIMGRYKDYGTLGLAGFNLDLH